MNDVIEAMLNRRSIRKYKAEMPPKEMIDEIVKAGLLPPLLTKLCVTDFPT